jgi:hypothetical protein
MCTTFFYTLIDGEQNHMTSVNDLYRNVKKNTAAMRT